MKKLFSYHLLPILVAVIVLSCEQDTRKTEPAGFTFAHKYGLDTSGVVYFFYQKYGFTDICEDFVMVSKVKDTIAFGTALPFQENIKNSFLNSAILNERKGTPITSLLKRQRQQFRDIELEFEQLTSDSSFSFKLQNGTYDLRSSDTLSFLKLYDADTKLLYVKIHTCDGT